MKKNSAFVKLVDNAFDFLDKAGREFEKEPKYSVIHFYAALELFAKARLLHEHWTLILSKPETGDLVKFQKGDFHSVTLVEAQKRLSSVIQEGLSGDEFNCFLELGGHRNRMVHFFHPDQHAKKLEIEAIVSQQCRAWFYLHRILTQRWKAVFSAYQGKVAAYDRSMRKQRRYLKEKFAQLKDDIVAAKKAGSIFHKCPSCGYRAWEQEESNTVPLLEFNCRVCGFSANGVEISCPNCKADITLIGEAWHHCGGCGESIEPNDVLTYLTSGTVLDKDDLSEGYEVNCGTCGDYHSVIKLGGQWFCTNCFETADSAEQCEWCHDLSTGDTGDSYVAGCGHCEGRMGYEKDD